MGNTRYASWVVVGHEKGPDGKWHERRVVAPKGKKFKITKYPMRYTTAQRVNDSVWQRTSIASITQQEKLDAEYKRLKEEQELATIGKGEEE